MLTNEEEGFRSLHQSKTSINNFKEINMAVDIIMGALWGDEGKGKISDFFASKAKAVVRWSGGNNAGHTVVVGKNKYKLHLMPSGVVHKDTYAVVANGCVLNPEAFIKEIEYANKNNLHTKNIIISDRAHVIMPYHLLLDEYQEEAKKESKIGTTKKGIGPAYTDKVSRNGIRMVDFIREDILEKKLKVNVEYYNKLFKNIYQKKVISFEKIFNKAKKQSKILKPFVKDTSKFLNNLAKNGEKIVYEGAQGALLDLDHGTYPFVTSSNPIASAAFVGSGINIKHVKNIYGITKAYCSRVGAGPMPTIIKGKIAKHIQTVGNEFGTTTGRARDVGWLDLVALKYSIRNSSMTSLVVTLLDVLTGIKEIKICISYEINGQKNIQEFPAVESDLSIAKPEYITFPGWKENITKVKSFDELPINAQNYINKIEQLSGLKVSIFSVGPRRKQTIVR